MRHSKRILAAAMAVGGTFAAFGTAAFGAPPTSAPNQNANCTGEEAVSLNAESPGTVGAEQSLFNQERDPQTAPSWGDFLGPQSSSNCGTR
jgi:hypothetical protein